ncbi:MAG: GFA family protein [Methyloceanibacter sp.]
MAGGVSGGCACGAVRYEAGAAVLMMNCHCRSCQRASGSAYAAFVVVPKDSFQPTGELRYYECTGGSGKKVRRGFCPTCGSPVAIEVDVAPGIVALLAGSLDTPSAHSPAMDIFTLSAQPWDHMSPDTRKVAGGIAE